MYILIFIYFLDHFILWSKLAYQEHYIADQLTAQHLKCTVVGSVLKKNTQVKVSLPSKKCSVSRVKVLVHKTT